MFISILVEHVDEYSLKFLVENPRRRGVDIRFSIQFNPTHVFLPHLPYDDDRDCLLVVTSKSFIV